MRLQLDPEWAADCERDCCQLIRFRVVTGENARGRQAKAENIGKTREEGCGFYATLAQVLTAYLQQSVQSVEGTQTAQEVKAHIDRCEANILAACAKLPMRGVA